MLIRRKLGYIVPRNPKPEIKNGKQYYTYGEPFAFFELYMPLDDTEALETYGDTINRYLKMFPNYNEWYGKIKPKDRAYLIDAETTEEDIENLVNTDNKYRLKANYKVVVVAPQNLVMKIHFKKITEGDTEDE